MSSLFSHLLLMHAMYPREMYMPASFSLSSLKSGVKAELNKKFVL